MNEKPILFSAAMVRAILQGSKTQTRRVVKGMALEWLQPDTFSPMFVADPENYLSPYGYAGDALWVRETWKCEELLPNGLDGVRFAADGAFRAIENTQAAADAWLDARRDENKWRPSIFMPRWASRINLKIVNVRIERVQDITRDDAKAEGVSNLWTWNAEINAKHPEYFSRALLNPYIANYSLLWDEINAKRGFGWDVNPWVWVVEFKVSEVRDAA